MIEQPISDLGEFEVSKAYEVVVNLDPEKDFWKTGMKTKYHGKEVMIVACKDRYDWKKVIEDKGDYVIKKDMSLCTFLIVDL